MSTILGWLTGFTRFWHHFIIGDDWSTAATAAAALTATWLLQPRRPQRLVATPLAVVTNIDSAAAAMKTPASDWAESAAVWALGREASRQSDGCLYTACRPDPC